MKFKKIGIYLSICLSIVLCLPSVTVFADSDIRFFTSESIEGFFSGTVGNSDIDRSTIASSIYITPNSFITDNIIEAFNNFPVDPVNNNSSPLTSGVWFVCVNPGLNSMTLYWPLEVFNGVSIDWVNNPHFFTSFSSGEIVFITSFDSAPGTDCYMMRSTYNFTSNSWSSPYGTSMQNFNILNDDNQVISYCRINSLYGTGLPSYLLSCSNGFMGLYSKDEYDYFESSTNSYHNFVKSILLDNYSYTNYLPSNLPYYNGTEIIYPNGGVDLEESNENHLYLTNFDIGFCKPYHNEDLYRAGGGYVYLKYNFDSWVNSHISDYNLQIITELNVNGDITSYPTVRNLDAQGISVFSFKEMASSFNWDNQNMLFLEYPNSLFGNYNIGYVYSLSANQYINSNFGARSLGGGARSRRLFYSGHGSTVRLTGDESNSTIQDYFTGSSNTQFKISFIVRLVDVQSNEVSGSYVEQFDLISGVSTVSNDQIRDNTNPYISDTDIYVPVEGSDGGYEVVSSSDVVNVYNMTPSQIKLTIDNGLSEFVEWYNNAGSGEVATNYFWGTLVGTFKDNPATELYGEYFGFLPDSFKNLILACCGIGVVGGVFSILRHKL